MPLRVDAIQFNDAVDAFELGPDGLDATKARLRILVEGNGVRTTLLYADTGSVPEVQEHYPVERMWIDISGYVLEVFVNIEDGLLNIEAIDDTSALITCNQEPLIHFGATKSAACLG